jgi:hypothetical protein
LLLQKAIVHVGCGNQAGLGKSGGFSIAYLNGRSIQKFLEFKHLEVIGCEASEASFVSAPVGTVETPM